MNPCTLDRVRCIIHISRLNENRKQDGKLFDRLAATILYYHTGCGLGAVWYGLCGDPAHALTHARLRRARDGEGQGPHALGTRVERSQLLLLAVVVLVNTSLISCLTLSLTPCQKFPQNSSRVKAPRKTQGSSPPDRTDTTRRANAACTRPSRRTPSSNIYSKEYDYTH